MAKITTTLLLREKIAYDTVKFDLKRPPDFNFQAGQYIDVSLIDPPENDSEGVKRSFSIASAPEERELFFVTRMRDTAFKRVLGNLAYGSKLELEGPFGSFILHENQSRPAVFLTGGIGITPARSIIVDASLRRLTHPLYLFYSNRRLENAAFLENFYELENLNPNLTFVPIITRADPGSSWVGERERINTEMLKKYLPDLQSPIFYISGPPGMVSDLRTILKAAGVSADNIRYEEFAGY